MLHICCIRAGEAFSPDYVLFLKDMVARNLEGGFEARFVCFTDRPGELPDHIETAPLPADLPGWWSKLALFREGLFPAGDRVLFLDLDTVITGAIDRVAAHAGGVEDRLTILRDFYRPDGLQSSVMAWRAGEHQEIWDSFQRVGCPMSNTGGDQAWIELVVPRDDIAIWQDLFPKLFVSYKQTHGIPNDAAVVVFHGRPRPHEVTEGWVPKVWCLDGLSSAELKAVCNTATEALFANVRSACARDLRWFDAENAEHDRHVAIVGGGPSVVDLIEEIKRRKSNGQDVWVLNNAWHSLGAMEFDAQVMCDARPQNASFVTIRAKEYLIASQCDPIVFEVIGGYRDRITLWHVNMPGMADLLKDEKARVTYLIGGGTTVGMNALALAVARGYRQIHLYGFDSSFRGSAHHAYPQALNDKDVRSDVLYGERHYVCAPWMVGQAQEFMEMAPRYESDGVTITVHGEGLLPDIAKDLARHMTPPEIRANEVLTRCPGAVLGVEIGVFAGEMSRALLKAKPDLALVMVDSWEAQGAAYASLCGDWHAGLTAQNQDGFYQQAVKRVAFAGERARIMRTRSDDARYSVEDESCDFVFIDADHSYEGCAADIEGWRAKVRPGGLLGGHDYQNYNYPQFGVTRAVDEFVTRHGLTLETGENYCWFVQL